MPITLREKEVAEILLDLPALILKSDRARGFPFSWGRKRRRSAISVSPSPPRNRLPPPPPFKGEASSPATPLSFSPSESDENNNSNNPSLFRRNVSLKRKREHYLKIVEDITKDNELLQGEIQNVKSYLHRLKDFNSELKARKHELIVGPILQPSGTAERQKLMAEPPLLSDCEARGKGTTSLGASTSGNVGPNGIPDLNMPFEEEERVAVEEAEAEAEASRNLSRSMAAAQARQNRLQIQRVKNPIGSNKNRYSFR